MKLPRRLHQRPTVRHCADHLEFKLKKLPQAIKDQGIGIGQEDTRLVHALLIAPAEVKPGLTSR